MQFRLQGDVVYAYYGRQEDYDYLATRNINISGKIALVRYGTIFRGLKVQMAEELGAIGVIFFSDPKDRAIDGREFTYPNSWWMPGMGVELGGVYNGNGDPLTPFYPAIGILLKHLILKLALLSCILRQQAHMGERRKIHLFYLESSLSLSGMTRLKYCYKTWAVITPRHRTGLEI